MNSLHHKFHIQIPAAVIFLTALLACRYAKADCNDCFPRLAVKTNLLHDALLTPDLGMEISIARRFSIGVEGVWAWWGTRSSQKCWRVAGGWMEMRWWPFAYSRRRALSGHHFGIYGSAHKYDFCLGKSGYQSDGITLGTGISYGYSFRIGSRLNLDLSARFGYYKSPFTEYRRMCGTRYAVRDSSRSFFGPTSLEVTLVWFPGRGNSNKPDYR